jgi:hypothetical protein
VQRIYAGCVRVGRRVSGVGFDSRSGAWGLNRPMAMGCVQPPHKIHLGAE